jgi:hypothetical protein
VFDREDTAQIAVMALKQVMKDHLQNVRKLFDELFHFSLPHFRDSDYKKHKSTSIAKLNCEPDMYLFTILRLAGSDTRLAAPPPCKLPGTATLRALLSLFRLPGLG